MPFLIILFIVVPILELYVIIQVGQLIGVLPTLILLLADALLGSWLLKHEGRGAWRRFNEALAARRFPGKEVADGVLIVIGGTLLLTPGFLTDIFGLFLLLPPTRAVARRVLKRLTIGRFAVVGVGVGGDRGAGPFGPAGGGGPGGPGSRPGRDYDFDATAEEVPQGEDPRLPRSDRG
ncbi:MAG TPA: FxsA family protein [Solirubrobacterales bacterium]|nr:FxsA family protein [Solirubrobacterales bacterium]